VIYLFIIKLHKKDLNIMNVFGHMGNDNLESELRDVAAKLKGVKDK
jgi:hypothetical protein